MTPRRLQPIEELDWDEVEKLLLRDGNEKVVKKLNEIIEVINDIIKRH